ncbi:ankyrin [Penicillium taxi]|uniref:ankyrin n=1 Tax=Penicillium taxi TaxID=168475 RepID=UPI0025456EC9|nr:ankyrin [Penicillium taxi]KAJ5893983.1 ankyrin [Penicillium taxi]
MTAHLTHHFYRRAQDSIVLDRHGQFTHVLPWAAQRGLINTIHNLIESYKSDIPSESKDISLCYAAQAGMYDAVKILIAKGVSPSSKAKIPRRHSARNYAVYNALLGLGTEMEFSEPSERYMPRQLRSALQLAIENNHDNIVHLLLESGADASAEVGAEVGAPDTALQTAIRSNNEKLVRLLLDREITQPELKALNTAFEMLELHTAVRRGDWGQVALSFRRGFDLEAVTGPTVSRYAPIPSICSIIPLLLEKGADCNIPTSPKSLFTPLHYAAQGAHEEFVRLLLVNGAKVMVTNYLGYTPLHYAANSKESVEVVRLLLDKGADANSRNLVSWTPLHCAASCGSKEVVRLLLDNGADVMAITGSFATPLHAGTEGGSGDIVRMLLERGANVMARAGRNNTPLHQAAIYPINVDVIRALLDFGADIMAVNFNEETPLHHAVMQANNTDVVRLLLDNGADVMAVDMDHCTPLHFAAEFKNGDSAKVLLDNGADLMAADVNHRTPLHHAVDYEGEKVMMILLEKGADVMAVDDHHETPLHYAARVGGERVVRMLLEKGASVSARDDDGWTPLHHAIAKGGFEASKVVKALIEYGADMEAEDNNGLSPMDRVEGGRLERIFQQGSEFRGFTTDESGESGMDFSDESELEYW